MENEKFEKLYDGDYNGPIIAKIKDTEMKLLVILKQMQALGKFLNDGDNKEILIKKKIRSDNKMIEKLYSREKYLIGKIKKNGENAV